MYVCDRPRGRLGNAIFRYLASSLFQIIYVAKRLNNFQYNGVIITDELFLDWKNKLLNNCIDNMPDNVYIFYGYYQHDDIYRKNMNELKKHIMNNPNDLLLTIYDGIVEQKYTVIDLLKIDKIIPIYDIVLHIRLEDFINIKQCIHPKCVKNILDIINSKNICIVTNKLKSALEFKYMDYLRQYYNIIIESNDVITDFHIMKTSKVLICSPSTLSWCAALLSDTVNTVYMPNYIHSDRIHETFKKPIENTKYYDIIECGEDELISFLYN